MKKFFFKEDGTLKVINVVIVVDVIVAIILLFMVKSIFGSITNTVNIKRRPSTTVTTTTIDLCNGCKINFKQNSINVSPGETYLLEDLLNLEKVNMKYVNFEISDESLAKMTLKDEKIALEILDSLGNFTLKASYYSEVSSMEVDINSDRLLDITFDQDIYYVKTNGTLTPKYELKPKGYNATNIDKRILNTDIATLDETGNIIGKKLGKTSLTISSGNISKSVPIYVVNSNVTVKVKENFLYRDLKNITYDISRDNTPEILLMLENTNLTYKDISYEIISDNNMVVRLEYVKKNTEFANAYEYNVKVSSNSIENSKIKGGATIIFTLTDGSKKEFRIETIETGVKDTTSNVLE